MKKLQSFLIDIGKLVLSFGVGFGLFWGCTFLFDQLGIDIEWVVFGTTFLVGFCGTFLWSYKLSIRRIYVPIIVCVVSIALWGLLSFRFLISLQLGEFLLSGWGLALVFIGMFCLTAYTLTRFLVHKKLLKSGVVIVIGWCLITLLAWGIPWPLVYQKQVDFKMGTQYPEMAIPCYGIVTLLEPLLFGTKERRCMGISFPEKKRCTTGNKNTPIDCVEAGF